MKEEFNKLFVEYLVLHHSASGKEANIDQIRGWHLDRGWDDIGYHWLIDDQGQLLPGRSEETPGAHAYGLNQQSLGICCIGNFSESTPGERMVEALVTCLADLCKKYNLEPLRIIGHRDVVGISPEGTVTHCPGDGLYHLIPAIRQAVGEKLR